MNGATAVYHLLHDIFQFLGGLPILLELSCAPMIRGGAVNILSQAALRMDWNILPRWSATV